MVKRIFIVVLAVLTMTAYSNENLKQKAHTALSDFFQLNGKSLSFDGTYVDTPAEFGRTCRISIDFTIPGREYLTISGEYTAIGTLGDGIYFDAAPETFTRVELLNGKLIVEQKFSDSFVTGSEYLLQATQHFGQLEIKLKQMNRFLFFTDTVEKRCIAKL
ncbi:hypothetical protein [Methylotuvimicrobium alcaliphilum]|uniref:Uncharacterized protein n=1 Tax=Methylotuvimicrobium alcaliphilum (strain DSM 19304 / NCIMB 14124 / VKM B-2133 / 20Z) TaxID=1091494 RepID=G4SYA7_META2|nr:hypothetical protein [Methylotuvimicrobium alcaliphilum]CCE25416.1 exported protein of unknown function [Methylotuvimicrobium alcaliphilum 20Z]